jgi:hypothetical protein
VLPDFEPCLQEALQVPAELGAEPTLRAIGDRYGARIGEVNGIGALPVAQALHLKPVFATLTHQVADDECGHLVAIDSLSGAYYLFTDFMAYLGQIF